MLVLALLTFVASVSAGNTTCVSTQLDWYTNQVGETPCRTYERLRQICNSSYQVGNFAPNTPGDNCSDQLSECCCNTIAFTLSMLCMSCQQCTEERGPDCIDAGEGAYELYLTRGIQDNKIVYCSPIKNNTLTDDIQAGVCNNNIRIPDTIYSIGWGTGAWFYTYSRSVIEKNFAAHGAQEFSKCPSSSSSASQSSTSQTATTTPSSTPSNTSAPSEDTPIAPIVGGVVGGLAGLSAIGIMIWFFLRRRSLRKQRALKSNENYVTPTPWEPSSVNAAPLMSHDDMSQPGLTAVTAATTSSGHTLSPPPRFAAAATSITKQRERELELAIANSSDLPLEDDRHLDAGPVPEENMLTRSASGRLPPSYDGRWSDNR